MVVDYADVLDDEVRAFLSDTVAHYPEDAVVLSISEQRKLYDRMCAAFDVGRPEGLSVTDRPFGAVPCRIYAPATPRGTVFYCHGGGFVVGGLDSHDSICAELAVQTGMRLVAVDYRLSPEHPFPADFEDALVAFDAVRAEYEGPLVLCGDSAGGTLVAAVAHVRRGGMDGQLLVYPGLGGDMGAGSYLRHANAPGLTIQDLVFYKRLRSAGVDRQGDARFAPLHDDDFAGLPTTMIFTAECDPLSSDGEAYCARLQAEGVAALWIEEPGLVHGYLRARHCSLRARGSFARIVGGLVSLRAGRLPDASGPGTDAV